MFKKEGVYTPVDKVNTIVGKETAFKGTLSGKGLIRIDGKAEGNITSVGDVVVGESGQVAAELKARNITIAGSYDGKLEASGKLELKSTARVSGTVKANGLIVEDGAVMTGNLNMEKNGQGSGSVSGQKGSEGLSRHETREVKM